MDPAPVLVVHNVIDLQVVELAGLLGDSLEVVEVVAARLRCVTFARR